MLRDIMEHFDWKFYVDRYDDLKRAGILTEDKAVKHWKEFGFNEGRMGKPLTVGVFIHLYHMHLYDQFKKYIENVKSVFSRVMVIISLPNTEKGKSFGETLGNDIHTIYVENRGVDIAPFFQQVRYIRERGIHVDYILKLHTKISSIDIQGLNDWCKQLITPLIKIDNLKVIKNIFKKRAIGYIGAQSCIFPKEYDLDFPTNTRGISLVCDKFPHIDKKYTDFVAGTIFWISNRVLYKMLTEEVIDFLEKRFSEGKPPCNLRSPNIHMEYVSERLFTGNFCFNQVNVLVNDYQLVSRGEDKHQPKTFSFHLPRMYS